MSNMTGPCWTCGEPAYGRTHVFHHYSPDGRQHRTHLCRSEPCTSDDCPVPDWPYLKLSMGTDCVWCERDATQQALWTRLGKAVDASMVVGQSHSLPSLVHLIELWEGHHTEAIEQKLYRADAVRKFDEERAARRLTELLHPAQEPTP